MHHFGQGYDECFKAKARDTGEYAYHITPDPKRGGVVILDDSADERAGDKQRLWTVGEGKPEPVAEWLVIRCEAKNR
jgi:hypothetical protein